MAPIQSSRASGRSMWVFNTLSENDWFTQVIEWLRRLRRYGYYKPGVFGNLSCWVLVVFAISFGVMAAARMPVAIGNSAVVSSQQASGAARAYLAANSTVY